MDDTNTTLTVQPKPDRAFAERDSQPARPPFECLALLLQGGGALGAYQGGVYQALSEAQLDPDWVAGISIGAVNAALIAGNPLGARVEKLREFWQRVSDSRPFDGAALLDMVPVEALGDLARTVADQLSAGAALVAGVPGFFAPRVPVSWLQLPGTPGATSYYDTAPLRSTLEELVDFDRINSRETRFSVGAVNVSTGNFVCFDNTTQPIGPEHVMASGALPPGFPAIEIEGERYWDGGLVSNTPLHWVLECQPRRDTLAFQVDLWSARGPVPRNMAEVMTRQKEIQYSSRTRSNSDRFRNAQKLRNAVASLLQKLPDQLRHSPEVALLEPAASPKVCNVVQLIYRAKQYEGASMDYEFSRRSMEEHWSTGYHDTVRTLRHREVLQRPNKLEGVQMFDFAQQDGTEE